MRWVCVPGMYVSVQSLYIFSFYLGIHRAGFGPGFFSFCLLVIVVPIGMMSVALIVPHILTHAGVGTVVGNFGLV